MRRLLLVTIGLALLSALPARAQGPRTGGDLLRECQSTQPAVCIDYLTNAANKLTNDETLCLPEGYDAEQLREVFIEWAQDNPDQNKMPVNDALLAAMKEVFPCEE